MQTRALSPWVVSAVLFACGSDSSSPAGASDADAGVVTPPGPKCSALPKEDATMVVDECGVFVSPGGDDAAAGTKAAPVQSFRKALELARSSDKHVFACGGSANLFTEAAVLVLTPADSGRALFGGFACEGWTYDATQRPTLTVKADTPVMRIDGATDIRIEDLGFLARNASSSGESSVTLFITGAKVTLRRVLVAAGRGGEGIPGTNAPSVLPAAAASKGNDGASGAASLSCACTDGASVGGTGGMLGVVGGNGADGTPSATTTGEGGTFGAACNAGGAGVAGAPGAAGKAGDHAFKHGEITPLGWVTRLGDPGALGKLGQGGGGGAAAATGVGGGGGCGGCGGAPGQPGRGGGSSIAIALYESEVDISQSSLVSGDGARGGAGGEGQAGQPGGAGGSPSAVACGGGAGGAGGAGGGGGGGPGGHSVAVLYKGSIVPKLDGPTSSSAQVGRAGVGGVRGGPDTSPSPSPSPDRGPGGTAGVLWTSD